MPPIDWKYGPPAGALTPLPLHSLLPESPDDAENSTPSAAPCWAIELVASANDGSLDSQPPNDELTACAFPSVRTLLYVSSICWSPSEPMSYTMMFAPGARPEIVWTSRSVSASSPLPPPSTASFVTVPSCVTCDAVRYDFR